MERRAIRNALHKPSAAMGTVLQLGRAVPSDVAGRVRVSLTALEAKLGRAAFHVWQVLLVHRDEEGLTFISRRGISRARGFVPTSDRMVKKGLQRLKAAGLTEDSGWRRTRRGARVFFRLIRGARTGCGPDGTPRALVPNATASWLKQSHSWGGRRIGAGRRLPQPRSSPNGDAGLHIQGGPMKNQEGPVPKESRGATDYKLTSTTPSSSSDVVPSEPHGAGAETAHRTIDERTTVGTGRFRRDGAIPSGSGIPPYPGSSLVPPAISPEPPLLDAESGARERALLLSGLYAGSVLAKTGRKFWGFGRGDISRSKHYRTLIEAADLMEKHEIPPAAWIAFSWDVWQEYGQRKRDKPPPIPFVFSPKRVHERRGWFRSQASDYAGGQAIFSDAHRELLRRYERMRSALLLEPHKSTEVVARYFPGDTFHTLLSQARSDATRMQQRLRTAAQTGDWLW